METALPLLLFLGFLVGSTLLILICGIRWQEGDAPAEGAAEGPAEGPVEGEDPLAGLDLPRFFGPRSRAVAMPVVADEPRVRQVEDFLRAERALAQDFVDAPSVESLHRAPEPQAGPSIYERLETFLRGEQRAAADFVSNPSTESLHGGLPSLPASA